MEGSRSYVMHRRSRIFSRMLTIRLLMMIILSCVSLIQMPNRPWSDTENDLIVADYFTMLAADLSGRAYNKADHNRRLQSLIGRGRGSIEYKYQNISAVLMGIGETWIPGYKPAFNFQLSLVGAVIRWLDRNEEILICATSSGELAVDVAVMPGIAVGPPPAMRDQRPRDEVDQIRAITRRFDVAGRIERNHALGRAGEQCVLAHERATLIGTGRPDLARRVRWVSEEDGDGAGFDIASFSPEGQPRLIEVKTTNGWARTPFYITRNEVMIGEERPADWCLVRLWNFAREPRAFELRPPLHAHVTLIATGFEARFG